MQRSLKHPIKYSEPAWIAVEIVRRLCCSHKHPKRLNIQHNLAGMSAVLTRNLVFFKSWIDQAKKVTADIKLVQKIGGYQR